MIFKIKIQLMFRLFSLIAIFLFCTASLQAQQFSLAKNETALKQKIADASSKIQSIQCDFTQEKKLSMMKDKNTSTGVFYFVKPNKVRLEYRQPNFQAMIVNGTNVAMKSTGKTTKVNAGKSKAFQQLNNIIVSSITGEMLESKDFSSKIFESDKLVKLELTPLSKSIKDFLESIVLILDKHDFTAVRLELNEGGGDYTHLSFSNKTLNSTVSEVLFKTQ